MDTASWYKANYDGTLSYEGSQQVGQAETTPKDTTFQSSVAHRAKQCAAYSKALPSQRISGAVQSNLQGARLDVAAGSSKCEPHGP